MDLALRVEEKNVALGPKKIVTSTYKSSLYSYASKGPTSGQTVSGESIPVSVKSWVTGGGESQASVNMSKFTGGTSGKNTREIRRLTNKELQEKRAKGLCFKCDDKWSAGHRCRRRELSVLLLDDDDECGSEDASTEPPPSPTEEQIPERVNEVRLHPEVSLNSVVGLSNPKTMKN